MNFKQLVLMNLQALTNFPYIEKDFDAVTDYQLLCLVVDHLNEVIKNSNEQNTVIQNLYNAFVELKDYVDNYFDNLDIQEEIDNKLDEMAESGELADIIAQYLEVASVLGFDTKASLKSADNLVNGSITRTLGDATYNDGKGSYYKIRTLTSGDVIDNNNILALANYPTLIAEKIIDYRMNQAESNINSINTSLNRIVNKKYIIVGDSYAEGYTPDGNVTGWAELLKNLLGLNSTNCTIVHRGGCGFTPTNNTYTDLINALSNDSNVTDIIVAGGYNDRNASYESIIAGSLAFKTACNTKFPNATIYLGFIGFTNTNERYSFNECRNFYVSMASQHGYNYLNNVEYSLRNTYDAFASDNYHPNATGQSKLSRMIYEAYKTGSATVVFSYSNLRLKVLSDFDSITGAFIQSIGTTAVNNIVNLSIQSYGSIRSTNGKSITCNGNTWYPVATITKGYITGTNYYSTNVPVNCVVQDDSSGSSKFYPMSGILRFEDKKMYIALIDTNDSLNNYRTLSQVKQIQVFPFNATFDSLFC